MMNLNLSQEGFEKWIKLSKKFEYEDYDLLEHNYKQINSLFKELQFVEANKDLSDKELERKFDKFIDSLVVD
jgi:hypothetical protein